MDKLKSGTLEQVFIDFAHSLLKQMRRWAVASCIPTYHDVKIVFSSQGTNETVSQRPFFLKFLDQNDPNGNWRVAAATRCVQLHVKEGVLKAESITNAHGKPIHSPSSEDMARYFLHVLEQPIIDALEQTDSLNPNVASLRKRYRLHRAVWESTSTKMRCTVPVINLHSETSFRISPSLGLLPFTHDEKTEYYARIGRFYSGIAKFEDIRQSHFKLAGHFFFNESEGLGFGMFRYEITKFLLSLRLLKPGVVGATALSYQQDFPLDLPRGGTILNDFAIPSLQRVPYQLLKKDVAPLKTLFKSLSKTTQLKGLDVALRRFNQSYSRESYDDKVIDLTIALESCLLVGEVPPEEIAYKFALRGAAIIAKIKDPRYTFSFLRYIYSLRSKIVHEGRSLLEDKKFEPPPLSGSLVLKKDVGPMYENYVRLILKQYIVQTVKGRTVKSVNADLDQKIASMLRSLR